MKKDGRTIRIRGDGSIEEYKDGKWQDYQDTKTESEKVVENLPANENNTNADDVEEEETEIVVASTSTTSITGTVIEEREDREEKGYGDSEGTGNSNTPVVTNNTTSQTTTLPVITPPKVDGKQIPAYDPKDIIKQKDNKLILGNDCPKVAAYNMMVMFSGIKPKKWKWQIINLAYSDECCHSFRFYVATFLLFTFHLISYTQSGNIIQVFL